MVPYTLQKIILLMEKLISTYNPWSKHPSNNSGIIHGKLLKIRPFVDDNIKQQYYL